MWPRIGPQRGESSVELQCFIVISCREGCIGLSAQRGRAQGNRRWHSLGSGFECCGSAAHICHIVHGSSPTRRNRGTRATTNDVVASKSRDRHARAYYSRYITALQFLSLKT